VLSPLPVVGPPADAEARLAELTRVVAGCRKCGLAERRKQTVFGVGPVGARLMFVGEGPGEEEDRQGLPFVGPAGRKLNEIIRAIGFERSQTYIANIVKCHPPGNRNPGPDEAAACRGYLDAQIDAVRPKVLVALGRIAAQALLGSGDSLARMRGQWYEVRGIPMRVTYHPSAILRDPGQYRRPTWEDMQLVRDRLLELG
jgi:DNA polymerase